VAGGDNKHGAPLIVIVVVSNDFPVAHLLGYLVKAAWHIIRCLRGIVGEHRKRSENSKPCGVRAVLVPVFPTGFGHCRGEVGSTSPWILARWTALSDLAQYIELIGLQPGRIESDVSHSTEQKIDSTNLGAMKLLQHRTPPFPIQVGGIQEASSKGGAPH
jgi:hypothetical protein